VGVTNPTAAQLGTVIRELRERRDLTLEDLAGIADLHTTYLSKIERGKTNPSWEKLRSLADALQMDSSLLVELGEAVARSGTGAATGKDDNPQQQVT
jgi:transcriptional regulator with XRE-family HTH domain